MKVVINRCFGGYSLSNKAVEWLEAKGVSDAGPYAFHYDRSNPLLVECVETLGRAAEGRSASLAVIEIPDNVLWDVEEYDGRERVTERHRVWC